ncbi:MAG: hypothetical protein ACKVHL_01955 [Rhodospirillales bacterium]|jgi:hypothetical protein
MTPEQHYRATQYPYAIPDFSFVFKNGEVIPIKAADDMPALNHRHPVIACGSNLSHERLKQKYGNDAEPLPVIRMQLKKFDTVYAAHFAHYGAIPATLHPSPGTIVSLALNWLSDGQLARMHETEKDNYHYCKLDNLELTPEFGPPLQSANAYISSTGCWTPQNTPIPLAAVPASNRCWEALKQEDALELAQRHIKDRHPLKTFIMETVNCAQTRQSHAAALQNTTHTFSYDYLEKLEMGL